VITAGKHEKTPEFFPRNPGKFREIPEILKSLGQLYLSPQHLSGPTDMKYTLSTTHLIPDVYVAYMFIKRYFLKKRFQTGIST
jgi:hypothetical protein